METHFSKQSSGRAPYTKHKRRFERIVASACVFCFVIVALLLTPMVVVFAEHSHGYGGEPATGCHSARNHSCSCDGETNSDIPVIFRVVRANVQPNHRHHHHHHHHGDVDIECMACALIQKVINPLRQFNYISNSTTATDCSVYDSSAFCPELITNGYNTPVEYKTQMNN